MATCMPLVFAENQLVEQATSGLFAELCWQTNSLLTLIAGREAAGAEEQVHNLRWMGHTHEMLLCVNWKS